MEPSFSRRSARISLAGLPPVDVARVLWWTAGLTPTARLRLRHLREGIRDGRGREASLRIARTYRA